MKNIKYILCILVAFAVCSCEDFVDIPTPKTELVSESAFSDDSSATACVVGMYYEMNKMNYLFNVLTSTLCALAADELLYLYNTADYNDFRDNKLHQSNEYLRRPWVYAYSYIYSANACIEGLESTTNVTETLRKQLLGEAKFVRAYYHFYLANMFGDVPLLTATDYVENNVKPRTPIADVYAQVQQDLIDAQSLMQDSYQGSERIRPNMYAATALLARVYLYTGQWDKAEEEATKVISNSTVYSLPALNDAFLIDSKEAIWQLQVVNPGWATFEGYSFNAPFYRLRDELLAAFEPGDNRFTDWVKERPSVTPVQYFPYKYKVMRSSTVTEYCMVLRLGEQYLIRAEARAQLNTTASLTGAKDDIDKIRDRAGLGAYSGAVTKDALLLAVEQERRIELFSEWGHRWFDLKRTGRAGAVLGSIKADWQETDLLFPLPESALRTNKNLTQNP